MLTPNTRTFTMGSGFAMEIRNALTKRGFEFLPRYDQIGIDLSRQKLSSLPEIEDIPCREFSNVSYWPSYELATREDIYREDGRHVRQDFVAMIVDAFIEAHRAKTA